MPAHKRKEQLISMNKDKEEDEEAQQDEHGTEEIYDHFVGENSDNSSSSEDFKNLPEWATVDLSTIRVNVQCPICLGIIKNTRTMMDCLHRFCRTCIEQSMRLGNNECPACRKHCASRRSLRDDPRFDAFIESLFDDVEKFEKEELESDEEAKARNKQVQDSIAKISQKQTEALARKRKKTGKGINSASEERVLPKYTAYTRRRGKRNEESEDNDNDQNGNKELSSGEESRPETKKRKYKRRNIPKPSLSAENLDSEGVENEFGEGKNEIKITPRGRMWTPELFTWGGAGTRSRCSRNNRVSKLTKFLENKKENDLELDVHCILICSDEQRNPSSQQLFLCCPPRLTVEDLKEYVASEIQLLDNDVDILLVKKCSYDLEPSLNMSTSMMQILEGEKTIAEIRSESAFDEDQLVLAYRLKKGNSEELVMKN